MAPEIEPERARQGGGGRRVLVILVIALILAGIAWLIADIYFYQISPDQKNFEAEPGQSQNAPPPSPAKHLDNPAQATPQQNGTPPPASPRQ